MITPPEKSKGRGKPRMRDIALRAGVSVGTVSRALNGKADVAPDLMQRVVKEAAELGYEFRSSARARSTHTGLGTIGYLIDLGPYGLVGSDPFQQHFITGIQRGVARLGGDLLVATHQNEMRQDAL